LIYMNVRSRRAFFHESPRTIKHRRTREA
jgi:hypothetical protein